MEENLDYLTDSYIRRKRWEWEQMGIATVNALAKAMSGAGGEKKQATLAQLSALGIGVANG